MVISHGFWQRHFGGDPAVVGRGVPVKLSAESPPIAVTVVGIMPAGFDYPRGADVFVPAAPLLRSFALRSRRARAQHEVAAGVLRRRTPEAGRRRHDGGAGTDAGLARPRPRGRPRAAAARSCCSRFASTCSDRPAPVLRTLLGGALLMLLIAAANVAGLQVSRGVAAPARAGDPLGARRLAAPARRARPRRERRAHRGSARGRPRRRLGAAPACSSGWRRATCRASARSPCSICGSWPSAPPPPSRRRRSARCGRCWWRAASTR